MLLLGLATSSPLTRPAPSAQGGDIVLVQAREGKSPIQFRQDIEDVQVPAGEAINIYRSDSHS